MTKSKFEEINFLLHQANLQINLASQLLEELIGQKSSKKSQKTKLTKDLDPKILLSDPNGKVIEGFFNGEGMIDSEAKKYPVPANYASKSKLVSGDALKLTILQNGTFIFKQTGPIDRDRRVGILKINKSGKPTVITEKKDNYEVLPASITYFKAKTGDKLTILVPKDKKSKWAAVESILPN